MKVDLMSEIQMGTPPAGATKSAERPSGSGAAASSSPAARAGAASGRPVPSSATVTLSAPTQALGSASDVVDMNKVRAMRAAMDNGSFKVNAEAIADKLLANAKEMLAASRSS